MILWNPILNFHHFFLRGSAYFQKDGNRRGYASETLGDFEVLFQEKMKEVGLSLISIFKIDELLCRCTRRRDERRRAKTEQG